MLLLTGAIKRHFIEEEIGWEGEKCGGIIMIN